MSRITRLQAVLAANLVLVGALIAIGVTGHSVGVWAEGADYLADAAAIGSPCWPLTWTPGPQRPDTPTATRKRPATPPRCWC